MSESGGVRSNISCPAEEPAVNGGREVQSGAATRPSSTARGARPGGPSVPCSRASAIPTARTSASGRQTKSGWGRRSDTITSCLRSAVFRVSCLIIHPMGVSGESATPGFLPGLSLSPAVGLSPCLRGAIPAKLAPAARVRLCVRFMMEPTLPRRGDLHGARRGGFVHSRCANRIPTRTGAETTPHRNEGAMSPEVGLPREGKGDLEAIEALASARDADPG